jgi:hypothetical protein
MTTETKRSCDKCDGRVKPYKGVRISILGDHWWVPKAEFCSTRCAISYLVKRLRKGAIFG